jgi:hypothetical protein
MGNLTKPAIQNNTRSHEGRNSENFHISSISICQVSISGFPGFLCVHAGTHLDLAHKKEGQKEVARKDP